MIDQVFEGHVARWFRKGDAAGYGFIEFSYGGRSLDGIFFEWTSIVSDNIGRRGHCTIHLAPVRFRLIKSDRKDGSPRAVDVRAVFPTDVEDPESHREISVVHHILKSKRNPSSNGSVWLKRECGEQLYLGFGDVADEFKNRFQHLTTGSHVWHGVAPSDRSNQSWKAVHCEFYSPEEEAEFQKEKYRG